MTTLANDELAELTERAERLSPEQLQVFIERLTAHLRTELTTPESELRWEDAAGIAKYPLCGEDAQAWVSRTRAESDERLSRR